jgi:hypothetical protein
LETAIVSLDPRTNTAHVAPDGDEHVRDGGWCPCGPVVLEVLDPARETLVGFVVAHHADGRPEDPVAAREDLIARLPGRVRAVVA